MIYEYKTTNLSQASDLARYEYKTANLSQASDLARIEAFYQSPLFEKRFRNESQDVISIINEEITYQPNSTLPNNKKFFIISGHSIVPVAIANLYFHYPERNTATISLFLSLEEAIIEKLFSDIFLVIKANIRIKNIQLQLLPSQLSMKEFWLNKGFSEIKNGIPSSKNYTTLTLPIKR